MRVFFNTPGQHLQGGPATHLYLLEEGLQSRIHLEHYDYGRRTDHETVREKVFGRFRDLWRLHRRLQRIPPDVIHHNSAFDRKALLRDVPLAWLARWHRVPLFIKFHGSSKTLFGAPPAYVKALRRSLLKNVTRFGVLSPVEKMEFVRAWPDVEDRIDVVKNIIKPDFLEVERKEAPAPAILFISRFLREKGMFDLLASVPRVLAEAPDAVFTFIGSGPAVQEFRAEVARQQLDRSVKWLGHIGHKETIAHYATAWAFVFPTRFPEGMPMVVAEAMAAGVPIISTRTRFARSYMEDGKDYLSVEYEDPASIAHQVLRLLRDPHLRHALSCNGRTLAREFTAAPIADEFVAIYERMVADKKQSARERGSTQ